jgi:hypothetical protein
VGGAFPHGDQQEQRLRTASLHLSDAIQLHVTQRSKQQMTLQEPPNQHPRAIHKVHLHLQEHQQRDPPQTQRDHEEHRKVPINPDQIVTRILQIL